jgi:GH24 family phage-related lysozyme (muramidase)
VNDAGKLHIQKSEGDPKHPGTPVLTVYADTAGNLTTGYGHKLTAGDNLKADDKITQEKASKLLDSDIASAVKSVRSAAGTTQLSQGEFNALIDLVFNVGPGVLTSTKSPGLMNAFGAADYSGMSEQLMYSKDSKGNQQDGLVTRSDERKEIFMGKDPQ